jgi:hypothetical protein
MLSYLPLLSRLVVLQEAGEAKKGSGGRKFFSEDVDKSLLGVSNRKPA